MVAAIVYVLVPPFVPVIARLGEAMPLSARVLLSAYPFAIVLPLATAAVGGGVLVFLLLVLQAPMFELS